MRRLRRAFVRLKLSCRTHGKQPDPADEIGMPGAQDDQFNELPDEMLRVIFSLLTYIERKKIERVCQRWEALLREMPGSRRYIHLDAGHFQFDMFRPVLTTGRNSASAVILPEPHLSATGTPQNFSELAHLIASYLITPETKLVCFTSAATDDCHLLTVVQTILSMLRFEGEVSFVLAVTSARLPAESLEQLSDTTRRCQSCPEYAFKEYYSLLGCSCGNHPIDRERVQRDHGLCLSFNRPGTYESEHFSETDGLPRSCLPGKKTKLPASQMCYAEREWAMATDLLRYIQRHDHNRWWIRREGNKPHAEYFVCHFDFDWRVTCLPLLN